MVVIKRVREVAAVIAVVLFPIGMANAESSLDGTWVAREATLAGGSAPNLVGHRLIFEGDKFRITRDGKLLFGGRYSVDVAAKPPSIDFIQSDTESLAGVWRGIYELAGNTLKTCDNSYDMEKPRPKIFDDCAAAGYVVFRFTR